MEKHLFPGGAAKAKCTDDESEGSPDIVMGEPSLVHDSSEVLMTNENSTGSEIVRRTPNMGARVADHVLDPEPNLPDHAYERQPRGSSLGLKPTNTRHVARAIFLWRCLLLKLFLTF